MAVQNPKIDRSLALQDLAGVPFRRSTTEPAATTMPGQVARSPASENDYGDHLTKLVQYFEESEEQTADARKLSERDRDYYDNDQWTPEELAILRKRKQPPLTINYISRKVETLRGYERRMRSDPKAYPRNPQDEDGANAATDALRFVADQNDFDVVRSSVYENLLVEGFGGADVTVAEMPNGETRVQVEQVPWDRIIIDPHSRKSDFSDARYKGIVIWLDGDEARSTWPEGVEAIDDTFKSVSENDTYGDRPTNAWCDSKRKRVRVVQMHYKSEGEWMVCTYTKGGFLEPPVRSPYVDKYGQSASSLILRSAYIDRKNNRYGAVRGMISLQDEINKRRSKALHLLSVRQTFGTKTAIQDTQAARVELAKPDGHVEINGGSKFGQDFGVLPTSDMAQGQLELMQQAVSEMVASGPNAAMAGKGNQSQSGRAWEAQQQAGAVEMEPLVDELRQWTRDVYEAIWMRVRQFWTDQVWVRVTDDERNIKFVGLNKKTTMADRLAQLPPDQRAQMMQQMQLQPNDPRLQEVVGVENDVSGLDVDIVIEEGPNIATLQSEQFQTLAELAKSGIGIPPKAIIQASTLRNKDMILDEMEKGQQIPPKVQEEMQKMQQKMQQLEAENQRLKVGEEWKMADIQLKREQAGQGPQVTPKEMAEAELKAAQTDKTRAEADQTRVETMQLMAGQHSSQMRVQPRTPAGDVTDVQSRPVNPMPQAAAPQAQPKRMAYDNQGNPVGFYVGDQLMLAVRDESGRIVGAQPAQSQNQPQ